MVATAAGVTNKRKCSEWQHVAAAVNQVSIAERTVPEFMKKWSEHQGHTELTPLDTTIATIPDNQVIAASCWKGRETQTWLTQMNQVGIFYLHFMAMQNKLEIMDFYNR